MRKMTAAVLHVGKTLLNIESFVISLNTTVYWLDDHPVCLISKWFYPRLYNQETRDWYSVFLMHSICQTSQSISVCIWPQVYCWLDVFHIHHSGFEYLISLLLPYHLKNALILTCSRFCSSNSRRDLQDKHRTWATTFRHLWEERVYVGFFFLSYH